jgi:hypothetical protein
MGRRMTKDYVVAINKLMKECLQKGPPKWSYPVLIEKCGLGCGCVWCKSSVAFLEFIKTGAIKKEKDV